MNGDIIFNGNIGGNVAGTGELNGDISLPSGGGVTPDITMSAYVDNNTGVPSVDVTKSGTDEEPHFTLDFHNLKGETGETGNNGYSPEITITPLTGGNRINITSEEYPSGQTFDVMNGQNGQNGQNGINGVSPVVTITEITDGHEINITDIDHPSGQAFDVMNGQNGQNGENGYSPAVTITEITGGHEVNITDFLHPSGQTFDVMNGQQGPAGEGVPDGGVTGQFLKKSSNDDYDTEWSNINASDVGYDNTSSGLTSSDVQGAIDVLKGDIDTNTNDISQLKSSLTNYTEYIYDEVLIGKRQGFNLYRRRIDFNNIQCAIDTEKLLATNVLPSGALNPTISDKSFIKMGTSEQIFSPNNRFFATYFIGRSAYFRQGFSSSQTWNLVLFVEYALTT